MELQRMKFAFGLILSLIGVVYGKAIANSGFDGIYASQQTLFRRSPNLVVQSQGYGGGSGDGPSGGFSSTSLQFNNGNNDPNSGLRVQSNAVGYGNGDGGGGKSSTDLQFNTDSDYPANSSLHVQSNAAGVGNGSGGGGTSSTTLQFNNGSPYDASNPNNDGLSVQTNAAGGGNGNGSGGVSSTDLHFNSGNNPNSGLSVQSHAVGAGNGNDSTGVSSTSLQFNNGSPRDVSSPNNDGLSVQTNAVGGGNGNGSGGVSSTDLQFNSGNNPNSGLSVQSHAVGAGNGNDGTGLSSTSLQFNNGSPCDGSSPNNDGLSVQTDAVGGGNENGSRGVSSTDLQFNSGNNRNSGLSVQSRAVGAGNGNDGTGVSSTSLQFNNGSRYDGSNPNNSGLSVESDAVGLSEGDSNTVAASKTTLQTTNSTPVSPDQDTDKNLSTDTVGATPTSLANGEQGVASTGTQIHKEDNDDDDETVDVSNFSIGTGNNADTVSDTSVQQADADGKKTKVDIMSMGCGSAPDAVAASKTSVNIDNNNTPNDIPAPQIQGDDNSIQVQSSGVGEANKNGAIGMSTNSVVIKDNEGDIQLDTLAAGLSDNSGSSGTSGVKIDMADGKDTTPNNDLEVKSTNTAIVSSDQNLGGSISTVQVDDEKNERSIEAQTVGLGYSDDNSSGTLTADSMKYHDVDQEHHQVVSPQTGSVFQSSKHETNDIASQNMSSQYNTVDDDGTSSTATHSTTTQTKQTQVMQKSYTEQQIINQKNQGYISDQQVDQNQSTLLAQQSQNSVQTREVNPSQDFVTPQQSGYFVNNQDSTLAQQQTQTSQMSSIKQIQSTEQSQSSSLASYQNTHGHQASPSQCPDNNQGPGVVCHYEIASVLDYDNDYVVRPSQIVTDYCDVLIASYAVSDIERFQVGAFSQDEERIFLEIANLKNDNLKVIFQLQYVAYYEQYVSILNSEDNFNQFASSLINYLRKWNFDGIELPILLPQSSDQFYETSSIIKEKFPMLVEKLRSDLGNDKIISVCLPIDPDFINFAYDIQKILNHVDWFSIITLDYNVPDQKILQHTSPLTPQTSSDPYCIDLTVNYLLSDLQVPSDKLIINVPLYGSSFVLEDYKNKGYGAKVSGKGPKGPSSNVDGFLTISELCSVKKLNLLNSPAIVTDYDDVPTLVLKVTYARSKCLGGVGIHSISMDDPEGELCGHGAMPFTKVIAKTYDPTRNVFDDDDNLQVVNYIDKSTTNKYDV